MNSFPHSDGLFEQNLWRFVCQVFAELLSANGVAVQS